MVLTTAWKETHAYSLNDVHLIWQYLHDLPNCQIKITTKYSYHVYGIQCTCASYNGPAVQLQVYNVDHCSGYHGMIHLVKAVTTIAIHLVLW